MNHPDRKTAKRIDMPGRCREFTDLVYSGINPVGREKLWAKIQQAERKFDPPASPYQAFIGEIHGHTNMSDGRKTLLPELYFERLKSLPGLDFAAISDHDHGGVASAELWKDGKWERIQKAVQDYYEPGKMRKIVLPLVNPMKKKLTLSLKVASADSVSVSPMTRTFSMNPGEKINAEFSVHAASYFSASLTSPEKIQADLLLNNVCIEKISLSLIRKMKAGEPMCLLKRSDQYISLIPAMPGNEQFYWKGTDDLSAKIYLSWKENTLSLKAEVTDDSHCQPYTKGSIWKGDSIQFGLAIPGQNGFWKFGLAHLDSKKTEVNCWNYPIGFSDPSKAIKIKTSRNEKTKQTVYEASIPFSAIGLNQKVAAKGIGFNLIVNDNDGKVREGFLAAAPGMGISDEPSRWIMVIPD